MINGQLLKQLEKENEFFQDPKTTLLLEYFKDKSWKDKMEALIKKYRGNQEEVDRKRFPFRHLLRKN